MDNATLADHAARNFLLGRIDYERTMPPAGEWSFPLERMRKLLELLGDPQQAQRIVHVTGTKGKGSTAAMIAAVLTAAGYRTGLFTSPHLERLEERLAIDGRPCEPQRLTELIDQLREPVERMDRAARREGDGPTFFEILTAAALLHFSRANCDATVLEVGLGGRLDSTNVCQPFVSVLTTVSFDHMRQLGNTLSAIAAEKAGIIKPGVPVVSGVVEPESRQVIEQVAERQQARIWTLGEQFGYAYHRSPALTEPCGTPDANQSSTHPSRCDSSAALDYWERDGGTEFRLDSLRLAMVGRHQAHNAAVAVTALRRLLPHGFVLPESAIRAGLRSTSCRARTEILQRRPAIVLDAAHNHASIDALLQVLDEEFPGRPRVYLFAASRDKDVEGMLRRLLPTCRQIILTRYQSNPRGMATQDLERLVAETIAALISTGVLTPTSAPSYGVAPDPVSAWHWARRETLETDVLCATGSFFLAAELPLQRGTSHL